MKNKVLGFVKRNAKGAKLLVMSMMISMLAVCSAIGASAEGTTTDTTAIQEAFSSSLSTIQSDVLGYIALAIPAGLAILGTTIAVKKAISFAKGLIGRS